MSVMDLLRSAKAWATASPVKAAALVAAPSAVVGGVALFNPLRQPQLTPEQAQQYAQLRGSGFSPPTAPLVPGMSASAPALTPEMIAAYQSSQGGQQAGTAAADGATAADKLAQAAGQQDYGISDEELQRMFAAGDGFSVFPGANAGFDPLTASITGGGSGGAPSSPADDPLSPVNDVSAAIARGG